MEEKKYIITHPGLESHAPVEPHGLQVYVKPYMQEMILFWWIVFFATATVLMYIFARRIHEVHFAHHRKTTSK